jgi:GNAT superfamily N-acetyltransferase
MQVVDLSEEHKELYFICLEDWSEEVKEGVGRKRDWFVKMKERGLRVKLALDVRPPAKAGGLHPIGDASLPPPEGGGLLSDDKGVVGGMIQYAPIEWTHVDGQGLYFIYCIWVHGHKKGRGNFMGRGMGKALLKAAEDDARALGAKGMAAWGLSLPFWMKASWFKKQGYQKADKDGMAVLMWKPFVEGARPPRWVKEGALPPLVPGKVTVTIFNNGWCQAQNLPAERAIRAARELGDKVVVREISTFEPADARKWGQCDALFIDDEQVRTGPPPSYEKIQKLIGKRVRKLR